MSTSAVTYPRIREEILRDPSYPVHRIADQLRPYLEVLVDRFHPEQVILFGSYAYGDPTPDSDVDLLVIKKMDGSAPMRARRPRSPLPLLTDHRSPITRHFRHFPSFKAGFLMS